MVKADDDKSAMEHALQSVPADAVAKLAALARQHDIGENDPLWLFIVAARVNLGLLETSLEASKATQAAIDKVPALLLQSVERAENETLAGFQTKTESFQEKMVKGIERVMREMTSNLLKDLHTEVENAKETASKTVFDLKQEFQHVKGSIVEESKYEARKAIETLVSEGLAYQYKSIRNRGMLWGGTLALLMVLVGAGIGWFALDTLGYLTSAPIKQCIVQDGHHWCLLKK